MQGDAQHAQVDLAEAMASETQSMALAGVAARIANAGLVFLTQILFARALGVAEFGIYATANTLMLLVSGVATLGLSIMPQRFWPEYAAAKDDARLRGLMHFASWGPFVIGSLFALGGSLVAYLARDLISPAIATVTCLAMLSVPAMTMLDVVEGIALAKAWKRLAYGIAFVLRPLIVPVIFLAAWLAGVKPDAALAMASLVGASWLAAFTMLLLVRRKVKHLLPAGPNAYDYRRWLIDGLPVTWINGAFMLMTSTDVVVLALLKDEATVGAYSAAARLVALVAFVHHGLTWASGHHFSALHSAGDHKGLAAFAAKTTRWTFLPSVAAALIMALATPLFLPIFGKGFEGGTSITLVLLLGLLARAAIGPAEQLLIMTDNQSACAKAYGWAFLLNGLLCLCLVPFLGAVGAALSTALAYGAASLLLAAAVRQRLGFPVHILALKRASKAITPLESPLQARFSDQVPTDIAKLEASTAPCNPYALPAVLRATQASGQQASALICTDASGDVLGLWPLAKHRLLPGSAALIGPLVPRYDVTSSPLIAAHAIPDVLKAMLAALQQDSLAPRLLKLNNLQAEGPVWEALQQLDRDGMIGVTTLETWERSIFEPKKTRTGLLDSKTMLSPASRKALQRKRQMLADQGHLSLMVHQTVEAVSEAFSRFLALESAGWKGQRGSALQSLPGDAHYFETFLAAMAKADRAFIGEIQLDGRVIASGLFMRCGGEAFFLKTAYDEHFAKQSPGVILDWMISEWLCTQAWFQRLDSGTDASVDPAILIWPARRKMASLVINLDPGSWQGDGVVLGQRLRGLIKTIRKRLEYHAEKWIPVFGKK